MGSPLSRGLACTLSPHLRVPPAAARLLVLFGAFDSHEHPDTEPASPILGLPLQGWSDSSVVAS